MRWIIGGVRQHGEDGVAGVFVVLMMVLIGAGAMAVDVGQIYSERAQLQNAADSGALAVAATCAKGSCNTAVAAPLANANSLDNASDVKAVDLSIANKAVVTTSTRDGKSGAGFLSKIFASALNAAPATVGATATAVWGVPIRGPVFLPIALSHCVFSESGPKWGTEFLTRYDLTTQDQTCNRIPEGPSDPDQSKAEITDYFFWLQDPDNQCALTVDISDPSYFAPRARTATGSLSTAFPASCQAKIDALKSADAPKTVLLPVFDKNSLQSAGYKDKSSFRLYTFAAFTITGFRFGEDPSLNWNPRPDCTGACRGIRGTFTNFVSPAPGFELGSGMYHGVKIVELIR